MCVVIDTCTFSKVFNKENKDHDRFSPILNWIMKKRGKIIIGGAKYGKEVVAHNGALRILSELEKINRITRIDSGKVDALAREIKKIEPAAKFNDEHLLAMVGMSRCRVVCTDDRIAISYLKRR